MVQRFYFDTSVFGGVYNIKFDEPTLQLFEKVKSGEIICIYSDLTIHRPLCQLQTAFDKTLLFRKFVKWKNSKIRDSILLSIN